MRKRGEQESRRTKLIDSRRRKRRGGSRDKEKGIMLNIYETSRSEVTEESGVMSYGTLYKYAPSVSDSRSNRLMARYSVYHM